MSNNVYCSRGCIITDIDNSQPKCLSTGCFKLDVYNWLENIPSPANAFDIIEVRFKNTRKGFYRNVNKINLNIGDVVAVEASPGHDIGIVSLTGELVLEQMKKYNIDPEACTDTSTISKTGNPKNETRKIYRKAKPVDIEKWLNAIELEHPVMLKAREIAQGLNLNMKIGDVEFQGDKTKAIFYYIADERVDFRELIKILAEEFKIRVEMRQIGARQEAGRIGGIGSCGRELCCATWMTNFNSVTTNAARIQELSLNPLKLAGQCSKLKCCLNYELDCYIDARKDFPDSTIPLRTTDGNAYHQKTDIFKRIMWYSFDPDSTLNMIPITVERVKDIMEINNQGKQVDALLKQDEEGLDVSNEADYIAPQESLTRFDDKDHKKKDKKRRKKKRKKRVYKKRDNHKTNTNTTKKKTK